MVVVESESTEKNRQFVERLGAKLEAETNVFKDVFYKGDPKMMGNKALLFIPEKDLAEMRTALKSYRPFIEQFTQATNLVSLFNLVNTQFRTPKREENAQNTSLVKALPMVERIVREAEASLLRSGSRRHREFTRSSARGRNPKRQMYITFADGRIYLVTTHAVNEQANELAVRRLRELMVQTQSEVPGVNAGATGEPILEIDEMAQSERTPSGPRWFRSSWCSSSLFMATAGSPAHQGGYVPPRGDGLYDGVHHFGGRAPQHPDHHFRAHPHRAGD